MTERFRARALDDALGTLELEDTEARSIVSIAPRRGGMVTRFAVAGDEVLFMDESTLLDPTKNVRGGIPILFPISGKLAADTLHLDGATFLMKQHGFARNLAWDGRIADPSRAVATCVLTHSDPTYPAPWRVEFTYELEGASLKIRQSYAHTASSARPIQPGFHPYFRVADATKRDARVITDATIARDNTNGASVAIEGPIDLTKKEVDLHLLDPRSKKTTLVRPGARDVVVETADDFTVTVVWTLAGKDFVCVEPWTAPANAINEGRGISVAPEVSYETWICIALS